VGRLQLLGNPRKVSGGGGGCSSGGGLKVPFQIQGTHVRAKIYSGHRRRGSRPILGPSSDAWEAVPGSAPPRRQGQTPADAIMRFFLAGCFKKKKP